MKRASELWLSVLIVALGLPAHLTGLLNPTIYRDPAVLLPQNLGTDLVTLLVGLPLLAASTVSMRAGSLRARIMWLGALGLLVYVYGMYALGVRWNELFLVYVALFGLSLFALIIGLVNTDAAQIRAGFVTQAPVRSAAAYLLVIASMVAAIWLAEEVGALPWGYVLAGMLLVKATSIGLWVVAMIWFSAQRGFGAPAEYTGFFLLLTAAGGITSWRFLRALSGAPGAVSPQAPLPLNRATTHQ